MTISEQLSAMREALATWAQAYSGTCEVVARPSELVRVLSLKPGDIEELGRVDRKYLCVISVAAGLKISRTEALTEGTGTGAPFYDVCEEAREIIRHTQVESAEDIDETATDYTRMSRFELNGVLTDDMQIEFNLPAQLPLDTEA